MTNARYLTIRGATGQIRTARYNDKDHLVVPVTAMVEGVVWAVNSEYPEFVSAEELAETPQQWNGRGCFAGHPEINGVKVSGNTPEILEQSFGTIFDTASPQRILETRKLEFLTYLDPEKAERVGRDAMSVIERLRAGEMVEVSIGTYVESIAGDGVWNGKPFVGSWTNIVSDHLAYLPANHEGACSIDAGCGAPRTAITHLITAKGYEMAELKTPQPPTTPTPPPPEPEPPRPPITASTKRNFMSRVREFFLSEAESDAKQKLQALAKDKGESASMTLHALDDAIRAVEPGYLYVEDFFPDSSTVIYCVMPEDQYLTIRRSFESDAEGKITLGDDREVVEPVTTYQPVKAAEVSTTVACSCGGQQAHTNINPPTERNMAMKDSVKSLISQSNGKYTEADAIWLNQVPDDRLSTLATITTNSTNVPAVEPKTAASVPADAAVEAPMSDDEWLKKAPASIRDLVARQQAADKQQKTNLVTALKTAQSVYNEAELDAMSIPQLEKVAQLVQINQPVDFTLRGLQNAQEPEASDVYRNPPDPYKAQLDARKASTH